MATSGEPAMIPTPATLAETMPMSFQFQEWARSMSVGLGGGGGCGGWGATHGAVLGTLVAGRDVGTDAGGFKGGGGAAGILRSSSAPMRATVSSASLRVQISQRRSARLTSRPSSSKTRTVTAYALPTTRMSVASRRWDMSIEASRCRHAAALQASRSGWDCASRISWSGTTLRPRPRSSDRASAAWKRSTISTVWGGVRRGVSGATRGSARAPLAAATSTSVVSPRMRRRRRMRAEL